MCPSIGFASSLNISAAPGIGMMRRTALCLLALVAVSWTVSVDGSSYTFQEEDSVVLYANTHGPFRNPSETYEYYDLPFCQPPEGLRYEKETLGEVVDGNRLVATPYNLSFRRGIQRAVLCTQQLSSRHLDVLRKAVREDYCYEMFYNNLPMWGFIGALDPEQRFSLWTHLHFDMDYNGQHIVGGKITSTRPVDISKRNTKEAARAGLAVEFTYSVQWHKTNITFDKRLDKYRKYQVMPEHLHMRKLSVLYSCGTLLLTIAMACTLMSNMKNEFMKHQDKKGLDGKEETGWKGIQGDVFRPPPYRSLFCAFVGTGFQLLALALLTFMLALAGVFYPYNRGSLFTALIMLYALTTGTAGYTAASCYSQMGGASWLKNMLVTCLIYVGPFCLVFCFNDTVASIYGATAALPWPTIITILVIWALIAVPLCMLGYIAGSNTKADLSAPCRTTTYPREIPKLSWYWRLMPQMVLAGVLPFCAIYHELYYALRSYWGYTVWPKASMMVDIIPSVLLIVFVILVIVTGFVSLALTYVQLAMEDHRWWWRSFLCGGSTGIFVYGYSFYFFFARSKMSGLMQCSFFFGYMLTVCFALFLVLGTVGWGASLLFVRYIYRAALSEAAQQGDGIAVHKPADAMAEGLLATSVSTHHAQQAAGPNFSLELLQTYGFFPPSQEIQHPVAGQALSNEAGSSVPKGSGPSSSPPEPDSLPALPAEPSSSSPSTGGSEQWQVGHLGASRAHMECQLPPAGSSRLPASGSTPELNVQAGYNSVD